MSIPRFRLLAAAALVSAFAGTAAPVLAAVPRAGRDWPQFRGIDASGIADGAETPITWTIADGKNVAWKTALPGLGLSSPVVWGNLVCVTTAISGRSRRRHPARALRRHRTRRRRQRARVARDLPRQAPPGRRPGSRPRTAACPKIKRHTKATHANSTLATDGERLIAFFGSEGLYAYDMKGKLLWKKDLGVLDAGFFEAPEAQWETGSSPVLHDGVVVVQADVQKGSFLAAFDAQTGEEKWRTARADVPTWGTPTVHVVAGAAQVIVNGWKHIGALRPRDRPRSLAHDRRRATSPSRPRSIHDGLVYITNAHGPAARRCSRSANGAKGDITLAEGATSNAHVAWSDRPRRRLHVHAARLPRASSTS